VSPAVDFSITLDPATITSASAFLTDPMGNIVAAVSPNSSPDQVVIDPTDFLTPGTTYTIHVTPALQDIAGNALEAEFTSSFQAYLSPAIAMTTASPMPKTSAPALLFPKLFPRSGLA
jgi:hypothetical protein